MGLARKAVEHLKEKLGKKRVPEKKEVPETDQVVEQLQTDTQKGIYRMSAREDVKDRERLELLENLQAQYPKMIKALQKYEIATLGMPAWERVRRGLTPEILDKILKMQEPSLLLIPPTTRQSKLEAINKHPARRQKYNTFTHDFEDNDLWNGGKSKIENKWRVSIVEGVQDVEQDHEIYDGKRRNYEMCKLWVKKYEDRGLDVINDADTYLTLIMKSLADAKPVDSKTFTVLNVNGRNLIKPFHLAVGGWNSARVFLDFGFSGDTIPSVRLRGLVGVDVSQD